MSKGMIIGIAVVIVVILAFLLMGGDAPEGEMAPEATTEAPSDTPAEETEPAAQ